MNIPFFWKKQKAFKTTVEIDFNFNKDYWLMQKFNRVAPQLTVKDLHNIIRRFLMFIWTEYLIKGQTFKYSFFEFQIVLRQRTPEQCKRMMLNKYNKALIDKTGYAVPAVRMRTYITILPKSFCAYISCMKNILLYTKGENENVKPIDIYWRIEINWYKRLYHIIMNNEANPRSVFEVV